MDRDHGSLVYSVIPLETVSETNATLATKFDSHRHGEYVVHSALGFAGLSLDAKPTYFSEAASFPDRVPTYRSYFEYNCSCP